MLRRGLASFGVEIMLACVPLLDIAPVAAPESLEADGKREEESVVFRSFQVDRMVS